MALPEALTDPVPLAALTLVLYALVRWQTTLTWPEYQTLHGLRRRYFAALDALGDRLGRSLVNDKGGRDDPEFLVTVSGSVKDVAKTLTRGGGSYHLLSTIKRRPGDHGDRLSAAHVVWVHEDGQQTEAYLFDNSTATVDIYAHVEAAVTDPENHVGGGEQVAGDKRQVIADALADTSVEDLALDPAIARHIPPE